MRAVFREPNAFFPCWQGNVHRLSHEVAEGGRDPLKRYGNSIAEYSIPEEQQHRFYTTNFNDLMGSHA